MVRIGLVAAALGLAACATTTPSYYGGMSAQNVNCGAGVLGGALVGGLAGNQVGKGQGQDLATIAGATVGGLFAATRPECQPQAYGQPYGQPAPYYGQQVAYGSNPPPNLVGYDRYGRPIYR
jgi:outer membrane lipoprotein SlyB